MKQLKQFAIVTATLAILTFIAGCGIASGSSSGGPAQIFRKPLIEGTAENVDTARVTDAMTGLSFNMPKGIKIEHDHPIAGYSSNTYYGDESNGIETGGPADQIKQFVHYTFYSSYQRGSEYWDTEGNKLSDLSSCNYTDEGTSNCYMSMQYARVQVNYKTDDAYDRALRGVWLPHGSAPGKELPCDKRQLTDKLISCTWEDKQAKQAAAILIYQDSKATSPLEIRVEATDLRKDNTNHSMEFLRGIINDMDISLDPDGQ
ncbi:hypothetical protein EMB92_03425 [Bifidobacterium callitrichos]|uniref:Uncharacterized protein n=1 Tax=Bifidobacterium callitrichos TaxID=762209 RepID=A0A5M9ZEY7_9BIFI|nr:hypothetical protein [Bifidobacterium callitrichos]KAA8817608.1 hypothetical protein EMB92_03425 [Bifidobacterium callitrichos]